MSMDSEYLLLYFQQNLDNLQRNLFLLQLDQVELTLPRGSTFEATKVKKTFITEISFFP